MPVESIHGGWVLARDGTRLWSVDYSPPAKAWARVAVIHGLGEHHRRYEHVAIAFQAAGIHCTLFDLRGHGSSGGSPAYIERYEQLLEDIEDIAGKAQETTGDTAGPVFLFGHSLGAQLVLAVAIRKRVQLGGVIASAPWIELAQPPAKWRVALGRFLSGWLPGARFATRLSREQGSHDQAFVDSLPEWDRVHSFITARMYFEVIRGASWVLDHASEIEAPVLLAHGEQDEITALRGTQDLYSRLKSARKEVRVYAGLRHELHNEIERERVLADYVRWMRAVAGNSE
jgi:acylglycerol lipase